MGREELPERLGKWEAVYRRYRKWLDEGIWQRILEVLNTEQIG